MRSACRLAKRYDEIVIELSGHSGLVVALAYSPDGRTLASASADGTARLWDLNTGKLTAMLQSPAPDFSDSSQIWLIASTVSTG